MFVNFIYIFVHIVRGQPFLTISDDQTNLQSVFCPTSDFTYGVPMFVLISNEKKNTLVKRAKTTYSKRSSNIFCVYI